MRSFIHEIPALAKLKGSAKQALSRHRLRRAVKAITALEPGQTPSRAILLELSHGWGNEGFSANLDYLEEVARTAVVTKGPILECGSGLTSILLGLLAGRRGIKVLSLEHSAEWQQRVVATLQNHSVPNVQICLCVIREYDGFHWYDAPASTMPPAFSFVVCDGPPGSTPGGRYGLMPVLGDRISDALILLDDANRPSELSALGRWRSENGMSVELCENPSGTFARVRTPEPSHR